MRLKESIGQSRLLGKQLFTHSFNLLVYVIFQALREGLFPFMDGLASADGGTLTKFKVSFYLENWPSHNVGLTIHINVTLPVR